MSLVARIAKLACLGAFLAVPQIGAAETLGDALISAYRNSNLLEQNRAVLRAADEDVAQAVSSLRPVISFSASGTYANVAGIDGLSTSVGLTGQMTLYDFGRNKASVAAAKASVLATRQALIGVEQSVLLTAVRAYVLVRQTQEVVLLREANVRLIGQELREAQDRFELGEITRTDVSIAEAQLARARSELAGAQGDFMIARENYKLAVGNYPGQLSVPPRSPAIPRTIEEAREIALRTHPTILQLQHQVTAVEANLERAKAEFGPSLQGSASITDGRGAVERQTLTLQLNQTIYAGGRTSSIYRQALAQRDITRAQLQQAAAVVTQGVGEAWANLAVATASIEASDRQIRSAQTAFDGVKQEAELGSRTTLDVLDAEQDLLDARTNRLIAESSRYSGVYALLSSMGLMTASHLQLGIPTYDPEAYYNAVKNAPATSSQGKRLDKVLKAIGK